jgi:hypothetical protein
MPGVMSFQARMPSAVQHPHFQSDQDRFFGSSPKQLSAKDDCEGHCCANTVWTVDFETLVCNFYYCFFSADPAQEKEKKMLLPPGVSKSTPHTVKCEML